MSEINLKEVLAAHAAWLAGDREGRRADLRGAYLGGANLGGANLNGAYLGGANLNKANLSLANLGGANLNKANLNKANLSGAYLGNANLGNANLSGANLSGADLRWADLRWADLRWADLRWANLRCASLNKANLSKANLSQFQLPPETGAFTGWKKAANGVVLEVLIPENAARTSSLVGRKCRASHIVPAKAYEHKYGKLVEITTADTFPGWHDNDFSYKLGAEVHADRYDDDIRIECTHGIHFFMTKQEAIDW